MNDLCTSGSDPRLIDVNSLYNLMTDNVSSLLLLDVRSEADYAASHVRHQSCISVPATVIKPGLVPRSGKQAEIALYNVITGNTELSQIILLPGVFRSTSKVRWPGSLSTRGSREEVSISLSLLTGARSSISSKQAATCRASKMPSLR